ncbi:histidine kinase [Microbacterium deminutum]|uniref:histidine kinase n=1 Tax=Microbacterium deminutum TaxID=344164 RepID=A0ABP5BIH7_9MICO
MFRPLQRYQVVVDVSVAAVFLVIAASIELDVIRGMIGSTTVLGAPVTAFTSLLIAVIFSTSLAIRRLSPGLALAVAWTGAVLQMALGRPPSLSDFAIFGVLYVTAAYGTTRVYWAGLASALFGAVVITLYLFLGPTFAAGGLTWRSLPIAFVMLIAAVFALGLSWTIGALVRAAVRARENRLAQQRAEREAAVEQERVRIARDMHDVVAHSLAVVIAQADGARYAAATDPAVAADALTTISATARSALADVRLLLGQLRHSQGDGPQPSLADLEALYAQVRASGVDLRITIDPAPAAEPPAGVQLAVYRILQEALTNALRHGVSPVEVTLAWQPDRVELVVRNPLPQSAVPAVPLSRDADDAARAGRVATGERLSAGHGIIGMRERAQLAGGTLSATAGQDAFVVRSTLPIGGGR